MDKQELQILTPDKIEKAKALTAAESGRFIMDALESIGIKEATFKDGTYFRAGPKDRTIAKDGLMVTETATDVHLRFPKEGVAADALVTASDFKPTQKMLAAYGGQSQSSVSKKRKAAKKKQ